MGKRLIFRSVMLNAYDRRRKENCFILIIVVHFVLLKISFFTFLSAVTRNLYISGRLDTMLSIRQVKGISCLGYNVKFLHTSTTSPLYEIVTAKQTPTSGVAITSKVKKLNFPPFIKDMFVGKFNKSMLSYAEVLNYERHKMLESKVEEISTFLDNRKTDILDVNGDISPEIVQWCKTVGLHGLLGPVGKGGKDLLLTEVARIYEELGREISLSEYLYCSDILGYRAILEFGNARQQEQR